MATNTILKKYRDSLKAYSGYGAIISAATPLEFSRRDGVKNSTYLIKIGNSNVPIYEEDERARDEEQFLDITSFVETKDMHSSRDVSYELLLEMKDKLREWVNAIVNSEIADNVVYTKYQGVINVIDDQQGFYSLTQRISTRITLN